MFPDQQGTLILPRVDVVWGSLNLTCPAAEASSMAQAQKNPAPVLNLSEFDLVGLGPLVYDVRVSMEDQGQTPTGSMKWSPSGPAFAIYEKCIAAFIDYSIMVTFYYVTGKSITFEFYWAGQTETYGKDMDITVKMVSLLDGLINANFYATVQADKDEKGRSHKASLAELEKQYGVSSFNLIRYTAQAAKDTSESIVIAHYNDGSTFMDAAQNLVKDNGNYVFFNNIGTANAVVFTPYTHEERPEVGGPILFSGVGTVIDPTKRYGYFIGPGIIQSFTRTYEWQPPQKSQEISAILARKAEDAKNDKKQARADKKREKATPEKNEKRSDALSPAPHGTYQEKHSANIRSANNYLGPRKQDMFTKEKAAKLSFTTLMCPALVGIKPLDLVFIPTYSGDFMEDWIVSSVEYQQTQGGVDVAIQATREYGLGDTMSDASDVCLEFAKSRGLVGAGSEVKLEKWIEYAWGNLLATHLAPNAPPQTTQSFPSPVATPVSGPSAAIESGQDGGILIEDFKALPRFVQDQALRIDKAYPLMDVNKALNYAAALNGKPVPGGAIKVNDRAFLLWAYYNQDRLKLKTFTTVEQVTGVDMKRAQEIYQGQFSQTREAFIVNFVNGYADRPDELYRVFPNR